MDPGLWVTEPSSPAQRHLGQMPRTATSSPHHAWEKGMQISWHGPLTPRAASLCHNPAPPRSKENSGGADPKKTVGEQTMTVSLDVLPQWHPDTSQSHKEIKYHSLSEQTFAPLWVPQAKWLLCPSNSVSMVLPSTQACISHYEEVYAGHVLRSCGKMDSHITTEIS